MRSRAKPRLALEWALRAIAVVCLAWLLWDAFTPGPDSTGGVTTSGATMNLPSLSMTDAPVHVVLDHVPAPLPRDWLTSLRGAGIRVSWSGSPPAIAIGARSIASPQGGTRIDVASRANARLILSDDVGVLDSLHSGTRAASVVAQSVSTPSA